MKTKILLTIGLLIPSFGFAQEGILGQSGGGASNIADTTVSASGVVVSGEDTLYYRNAKTNAGGSDINMFSDMVIHGSLTGNFSSTENMRLVPSSGDTIAFGLFSPTNTWATGLTAAQVKWNGNSLFQADTTGNVGIGTSTFDGALDGLQIVGATMKFYIQFGTTTTYGGFYADDNSNFISFGTRSNDDFRIFTNGVDKMIIKAGGNIGINETNPATKFEVEGGFSIGDTTGFALTVAGAATINSESNIILDTQGTALDTATTLTGAIGQRVLISTRVAARDIRFLDSGNFNLSAEHLLDDPVDVLELIAITTTTWKEISFSDNN
ncbi:MAG: hypothetical protein ACE5HX_00850 [bacterium]